MSKTTSKKIDVTDAASVAKAMGISVEKAQLAINADKVQREKEALVVAKHGKGSGRINRQTGEVEELDLVIGSYSFRTNTSGNGGKWGMKVRCFDCGVERWLATSDLHQVARCEEHQKEHKAALRKAKRSSGKASLAASSGDVDALRKLQG